MTRRPILRPQLTKTLLYITVLAVCFVFAYIKDANAFAGVLYGKVWQLKSTELYRKNIDGLPFIVLKFSNKEASSESACKSEIRAGEEKLLAEIPVNSRNGMPNYNDARFRVVNAKAQELPCFNQIGLNLEELFQSGLAYVSGSLRIVSEKAKTEIAGNFVARVCN